MNVSLKINLEFPAAIYFQDTLQLNRYTVAMELCTATQDHEHFNSTDTLWPWSCALQLRTMNK